ncbi:MAG: PKD domain-containing protein, partial [Bacteroidia bacterium]|nr:PKD domain-containing protein [Bacteroidia bacterium]
PTYSFDTAGIYNVSLVTELAGGCQRTINQFAVYDIRQVFQDTIRITAISHCNPYSISLEYDTANVVSMTWFFGDGDSSNVWNPTHNYASAGDYLITLELEMDAGCRTTQYLPVTLGYSSPISFTVLDPCISDTIQFSASSPNFTSYLWDFGDGDSSTLADPAHAYQTIGNYIVSLTVTDIGGCTHTYTSPDTINTVNVFADFSVAGPTSGCNVLAATFVNNSIGGTSWFWDFGDGNTSTAQTPSHTYVLPGVYDVSLTVTDSGCVHTNTKTNYISVTNFLANFIYTQGNNCFPITATYTDQSLNAVSWLWEFGDSTTSNLQHPVHVFTEPPTGPIKLTITDINGCQITRSKTNISFERVDFSVSDSLGCVPFTTTFTDLSTSAIAWRWDFGDGNTSNLQNPTHTYVNNGSYDVQLIVDFASGCTDTLLFPNRFTFSFPNADFSSPTTAACSPASIDFVNQSTNGTTFTWDFGDSTFSNLSDPSHIYNIPGYYTVSLIASNNDGCNDTMTYNNFLLIPGTYTDFSVISTDGCPMLVNQFTDLSINASTWNWNFGDGYSSTVQNPQHLYADTGTFQVTLITTDTIGCSSVFTMPTPITIHPIPTASATVTNPNICAPSSVSFVNNSTNATTYIWDFGNGDTSHAQIPVYNYVNAGIYDVELIAISAFGCADTQIVAPSITVSNSPIANFIVDSIAGCAPNNVNFYSLSTDTIGANYNWTFGNGSSYNGIDPSVYYANPGNYNVLLTVNNSNGCSDTSLQTINIPSKPVANAAISDTVGCAPFFCQFSEQAVDAVAFYWDFGDGNTSTSANPSHIYINAGTYTPTLVVQNIQGCVDTFNFNYSINVFDNPQAVFSAGNGSGCNPHTEQFVNNSTFNPGATFLWEFGDGKTSTLMNPNNVFDTAGTFNISLTVTDLTGCWDSTLKNLNVYNSPVAYATVDNNLGCEPFLVNFTNTSQNGSSFVWSFGDNNLSVTQNPSHTYNNMGSYIPTLVAISPLGCADTFTFANPINVNTSPVASFSANDTIGCVGANIIFTNSSTNLSGASYLWTLENGITSNAFSPNIVLTTPGVHDITLVVTNNGGCGDTIFEPLYLHVRDTIAPPSDQVYSASVLNNNSVELIWDQSTNPNSDVYKLYRFDTQSQTYVNVYTDPVHLPNSDTVRRYVDNSLATLHNTYSYKLQTMDVCGNEIPIDEIDHSTTINLETVTVDADVYLSWTPYEGCNVSGYQIERTNTRTGITEYIETTSPLVLNYVDTFLICPDIYSYRIRALDLCNSLYTAVSDTDNARPYLDPGNQVVEVVRSTVIDDLYILTEWTEPNRDPHRVVSYEVYRSTDNVNFYHLESVPHYDLSYLDYNVDVDNQTYYYQIIVSNDCAIPNIESNKSSSILLKADWRNDKTLLEWTPYVKWKEGVGNYVIEKLDESGNWIMIKVVDEKTDSIEIDD